MAFRAEFPDLFFEKFGRFFAQLVAQIVMCRPVDVFIEDVRHLLDGHVKALFDGDHDQNFLVDVHDLLRIGDSLGENAQQFDR